jgi:hypothetical protein
MDCEQNQHGHTEGSEFALRSWAVENLMLGVSLADLEKSLSRRGISATTDDVRSLSNLRGSGAVGAVFSAGERLGQRLRKLESLLAIQAGLSRLSPNGIKVEKRKRLSRNEFLQGFYAANQPVILTGMMGRWPAMRKWSLEYFERKWGNEPVEVMMNRNLSEHPDINMNRLKSKVLLKDYLRMVKTGGQTDNYYLVASNFLLNDPRFCSLHEDFEPFPAYLDSDNRTAPYGCSFWLGPAGTVTKLHHDAVNIMFCQVKGRKEFILFSPQQTPVLYNHRGVYSAVDCEHPDTLAYPLFKNAQRIRVVLKPGEALFIPVGWWHFVKALDVSISLSFTNFLFPNRYLVNNPSNCYLQPSWPVPDAGA